MALPPGSVFKVVSAIAFLESDGPRAMHGLPMRTRLREAAPQRSVPLPEAPATSASTDPIEQE